MTYMNTSEIPIPLELFPLFKAKLVSRAFVRIKETPNNQEEAVATELRHRKSKTLSRVSKGIGYPDYGRK